ncbi:MAG TPA: four helix bundle protein [Gemmatimonadaceae bacterium]|jgi:four helix bundle protein
MTHYVPEISEQSGNDPLARMRAYSLARALLEVVWDDANKLTTNQVTEKCSGQLYAAIVSIAANLGEGYSRSSGKDRARIFEYALGSVRESMIWYHSAKPILGEIARERLNKLEEIRRLLLAIIPRERGKQIRPKV